jgi:hypothetical protein
MWIPDYAQAMADGEIILKLDNDTARRLREEAEIRGLTPEELGAQLIADDLLFSDIDFPGVDASDLPGVEEDLQAVEEFDRTREGVPWEEVSAWIKTWGGAERIPPPKVRKL